MTARKPRPTVEQQTREKQRAAALSVGSNTFLVVGKLVVGSITGSVAVISEAVHSAMDLLAAIIAFVAVSLSGRPPDDDHAHGHGKIEDLSGAVEALLIFGAVVYIGYEAVQKLIHHAPVQHVYLGVIVMGVSSVLNLGVSLYLERVARRTDSTALAADAAHLRTDVYTSLGVLVGLGLVHFTGLDWLDPVAALAVALLIVAEAWRITRRSVGELLDESLPPDEHAAVARIIAESGHSFHALRSRKSGPTRKVDLHLEVSPRATAEQVHATCDALEAKIQAALPRTQVLIHPEPSLELDTTQPACQTVAEVLRSHAALHRGFSEIHAHDHPDGLHVSFNLHLAPETTVARFEALREHLRGHLAEHLPRLDLFVQPVAAPPRDDDAPGGDGAAHPDVE